MILIILAIAWLLGILAADLFSLPLLPLAITAVLSVLVAAVARRVPRARLAALALCCAALGGARLDLAQVPVTPRSVRLLNDQGDLLLQGVVVDDPKRAEDGQRALVAAERVVVGGKTRPSEGLVLVKLPAYPERRYGDRLQLTGELTTPGEAERPGEFDYRQYLVRKRIFSLMEPKAVRLIGQGNGNPLWSGLLALRDRARRVLLRELPEPQASLAVGILLGLQSSIPDDVSATFSATGFGGGFFIFIVIVVFSDCSALQRPLSMTHRDRSARPPAMLNQREALLPAAAASTHAIRVVRGLSRAVRPTRCSWLLVSRDGADAAGTLREREEVISRTLPLARLTSYSSPRISIGLT